MVKTDGRIVNTLKNGNSSKQVKKIVEDLNLSALNAVKNFDYRNIIDETVARRDAIIADSYTNMYFASTLKQFGPDILAYESDMIRTQRKIVENNEKIEFHKKALTDLKSRYETATNEEKVEIYDSIDKCEKILATFEKAEYSLLELRNKIRKELDKKNFQKDSLEYNKSKSDKPTNMINDIDYTVLDVNWNGYR